jgi:mono/diheme cytochrome c family protein
MRRSAILLALLASSSTALADGRGQAIFSQKCAKCHVVGQGAPTNADKSKMVDITLAARAHDARWLEAFLQKPYAVNKDSACMAKVDVPSARSVIHFLRSRLKPVSPTAASQNGGGRSQQSGGPAQPGAIPPQSKMETAAPLQPKKPQGMVHR